MSQALFNQQAPTPAGTTPMQKQVLIATNNADKVAEISEVLADLGWSFISMKDAGFVSDPDEDGETFVDNALIKARAAHEISGMATLADDSGLAVDYLDGAPGVMSARYAGDHGDNAANNEKLLNELDGVELEKRTARFVCALAFVDEDGSETSVVGTVEGRIGFALVGAGGFGYDPLFYPLAYEGKKTFAEVPRDEKSLISHRGTALRALADKLKSC